MTVGAESQGHDTPTRFGSALRVIRAVVKSLRIISLGCAAVAALLMAAMIVLQVVDVVVRNTTGGSAVRGVTEYISVGLVFVVFLSIAHAEQQGAHVRTPILVSRLPRRIGVPLRAVALIVAACVLWALAYASLGRALDAYDVGELASGIARVPTWQARFAIPLGAILLGVELVARALMLDGELPDDTALTEGSVL